MKLQAGVGLHATGEDGHHGPITPAEDPCKGFLVDTAGLRGIARMRMNPNPSAVRRLPAQINLLIEELGDGVIFESHGDDRADLAEQHKLFHEQQVVCRGNPKTADFGVTQIPQEQQLGPRCRRKPECRTMWLS
jgi:hypothetical protein